MKALHDLLWFQLTDAEGQASVAGSTETRRLDICRLLTRGRVFGRGVHVCSCLQPVVLHTCTVGGAVAPGGCSGQNQMSMCLRSGQSYRRCLVQMRKGSEVCKNQ